VRRRRGSKTTIINICSGLAPQTGEADKGVGVRFGEMGHFQIQQFEKFRSAAATRERFCSAGASAL
jgi:hypothetical protein